MFLKIHMYICVYQLFDKMFILKIQSLGVFCTSVCILGIWVGLLWMSDFFIVLYVCLLCTWVCVLCTWVYYLYEEENWMSSNSRMIDNKGW